MRIMLKHQKHFLTLKNGRRPLTGYTQVLWVSNIPTAVFVTEILAPF